MPKQSDSNPRRRRLGLTVWALLCLFCVIGPAIAENPAPVADGNKRAERIHITADKLISETQKNTAEFIGNVRATQDNTLITSDRLKIFYAKGAGKKEGQTGKESIKKMIASGNVTIRMDDRVAVTEQAVYIAETDVLILTGPNSKITSEDNSVSGDKITLYRKDDRMIVDGSSEERVEAVLYTKDNEIQ